MSQIVTENGHAPQTPPLPATASGNDKQPVPESMTRFTVYVPSTLNDGSNVPSEVLNALQEHAVNTFGGYTLHPELRGGWLGKNRRPLHEPIFKIEIEVADRSQAIPRIIALANFICQHLGQKAVFVTIEDIGVLSV